MKKFILFILGISAMLLAGCSNGSKTNANLVDEDYLPADPPLGYVVELQPLGDFSKQEAEQLMKEFVKQLELIYESVPKAWIEASVSVAERKEIPTSCLYKPRNRYWAGKIYLHSWTIQLWHYWIELSSWRCLCGFHLSSEKKG